MQIAYHILQQYPFARFRFIGKGPVQDNLMTLAKRLKIDYAVEFVGWVGSQDLPRYLSDLDIVVNPSLRGWSETFCISNIEVMSMEIPLVTFAVGGIGEYVIAPPSYGLNPSGPQVNLNEDELPSWEITHNAVVVHSANPETFAEAMLHLIYNPKVARQIGRNGRLSLMNYFTIQRQMQQYEAIYQQIYDASSIFRR